MKKACESGGWVLSYVLLCTLCLALDLNFSQPTQRTVQLTSNHPIFITTKTPYSFCNVVLATCR